MPARDYVESDPSKKLEMNLQSWSEDSSALHKLKECIDYAAQFRKKFGAYMNPKDRMELADISCRCDKIYWKYFNRLVKRIQGIANIGN
ncbi:MAG: hypothetical protein ACHQXK_07395 [Methanosarcina thermophila]